MILLTIYLVGYVLAYLTLYREDREFYLLEDREIPKMVLILNVLISLGSWSIVLVFWYANFKNKEK